LPGLVAGSDVEQIFEKGEEGMRNAEGFIKQMVCLEFPCEALADGSLTLVSLFGR
jgi:hypothetical protein